MEPAQGNGGGERLAQGRRQARLTAGQLPLQSQLDVILLDLKPCFSTTRVHWIKLVTVFGWCCKRQDRIPNLYEKSLVL